jgi:hypothetical protein
MKANTEAHSSTVLRAILAAPICSGKGICLVRVPLFVCLFDKKIVQGGCYRNLQSDTTTSPKPIAKIEQGIQ